MRKVKSIVLALAVVTVWSGGTLWGQAIPMAPAVTLKVGDPAPAVKIEKWIKGTPLTTEALKDGRVHVVEFWATWCGPCIVGMPHLSELSKSYGDKVSFNGISVWESNAAKDKSADLMPKVEAFVSNAHDMMAYNIGADGKAAVMADTWMKAAGRNGIPCAFVVDKEGKIGWVGHPLMGLEEAVDLALEGKLTPDDAKKIQDKWDANIKKYSEVAADVQKLMAEEKYKEALAKNEELLSLAPFAVPGCAANKYAMLTHMDPAAATAYAQEVLKKYANAPLVLNSLGGTILDPKSKVAGTRDYALALTLLKQTQASMADYRLQSPLAEAYFKTGDTGNAATYQEKVVKGLEEAGASGPPLEDAKKKLEEYRAKAAG